MNKFLQLTIGIVLITNIVACGGAASARAPLVGLDEVRGGSLLFATRTQGRHVPAPLLATDVDISVSGPIARVKVRQTFLNPSKHWLEGRYVFPLPQRSAVYHMIIRGPDMEIVADIKEKEAARLLYNEARQTGRRAALVEQNRPNIFTTDLANLAPGGAIEVEISYRQRIRYDRGSFRLRFPMVVAPRFTPPAPVQFVAASGAPPQASSGLGRPPPQSPVLHPDAGKLNPVTLAVHLNAGVPLAGMASPHHRINATDWQTGKCNITLADKVVAADRDFELVWTPAPGAQPAVALFYEQLGAENFILAMVLPPARDQAPPPLPRDVVFVLDRSGSMAGASIRQAREALVFAVERLRPEDRFNILRFANETDALFDGLRRATADARSQAVRYVAATRAEGGTRMLPALLGALAGTPSDGRLRQIVFLTDAAIGNEAALFDEIAARIGRNRLFTVGIGSAPNSYFMQRAAELGRGSFTYIGNTRKVGEAMQALFRKIERPMATGLSVRWDGIAADDDRIDAYPGRLPDLYDGEPVVLAARVKSGDFSPKDTALSLSGLVGGKPWQRKIGLAAAAPVDGAGTLWGRARIADLMMSLHRGAEPKSVRLAVTATALRHHIVSPYTSLVATEKAVYRPVDEPVFPRPVPRNLPDGWEFDKVFGGVLKTRSNAVVPIAAPAAGASMKKAQRMARLKRPSVPVAMQGHAVQLPAGSTAAALNFIVGIVALLIGLIIYRRKCAS